MKNWEKKKLSELCDLITKGTTPTSIGYKFTDEGINFIKVESLTELGEIIPNKVAYIDEECHKALKRSQLKTNDILFSIAGALGRIGIVRDEIVPANTNQALAIIRLKNDSGVLVNYLAKYFNSNLITDEIEKLRGGAAQQNLSLTQLNELQIPLPPLPEQQHIVAILDEAFAAIAKAKTNAEQNLKNAKELFESYLQGVFENGNWETKTLNEISENLDSKRVPITKNVRNEGSIPYYGASGIVDYVADYLFDEDLLCVSEDGANLLARTYPIAFSISGKTWVNNHAHVLRFKNMVSQKFVELYLNSIKLDDFVSGMAQPKLNQTMLNKIPIPFPSLKEQESVVNKLDALSAETKKLQTIYQTKINDLEELKKSVLQKAFLGQLKMENGELKMNTETQI